MKTLKTHTLRLVFIGFLLYGPVSILAQDMSLSTNSPEAEELMEKSYVAWQELRMVDSGKLLYQVLEKDPDFAMANAFVAIMLKDQGKTEEAEKHLNKAKEKMSSVSDYEKLHIQHSLDIYDDTKNLSSLFELIEKYPEDKGSRLSLIYHYSFGALKDLSKAEAHTKNY